MSFLAAVALLVFTDFAYGDNIAFTAAPTTISDSTASLRLRCAITDDSTSSPAEVSHTTSIVISRSSGGGARQNVASVTAFDAAKALVSDSNIQVAGNINSEANGEHGFLQVTWSNPTSAQITNYECEATALDMAQDGTDFQAALSIAEGAEPTIEELLLYIANLENRTSALENRIDQCCQGGGGGAGQFESGTIECEQGTHDYPVTFETPYASTPEVFTAVGGAHSATGYIFVPAIVSPSASGFTLRCTSHETNSIVWFALG